MSPSENLILHVVMQKSCWRHSCHHHLQSLSESSWSDQTHHTSSLSHRPRKGRGGNKYTISQTWHEKNLNKTRSSKKKLLKKWVSTPSSLRRVTGGEREEDQRGRRAALWDQSCDFWILIRVSCFGCWGCNSYNIYSINEKKQLC